MAKAKKTLRVNVPFRVLPETLSMLSVIAEKDNRTMSNMFEVLIKEVAKKAHAKAVTAGQ